MMRIGLATGGVLLALGLIVAAAWVPEAPLALAAPGDDPAYEGADSCRKCHFAEHKSWATTKMAKAFEILKPGASEEAKKKHGLDPAKDYSHDASCVPCHVTGYGKPGGYPEIVAGKEWTAEQKELASKRENVSCESCHGPGSLSSAFKKDHKDYKWADVAVQGMVHPGESQCTPCHNDKSPTFDAFDYAKKVKEGRHEIRKMKADHACDHPHEEGK